ncbi:YMGG-like glycine zipper-containing protein [Agrobacterium sp. 16-2014-1-2a]
MKKIISGVFVCVVLTACSQTEKGAGIGAASGAIIGGLASGTWEGAAVGAAAGGAGGAVIGNISERHDRNRRDRWEQRDRRGYNCRYRDYYGRCR